ncbi:MAG: hypothetical protein ABL919_09925 [Methylococcales bacterium]|nr:hypothetical protein [Methylococcaceae bacterium]
MNKELLTAILILNVPLSALASPQQTVTELKFEQLTKKLELNDEQRIKVESILEAQKLKSKALHEETKSQLQNVLTPKQMSKLEELRKHGQPKHFSAPE